MPEEAKGFAVRMKEYFGAKLGQTTAEFMQELRALTYEDKMWFHGELNKIGLLTIEPVKT